MAAFFRSTGVWFLVSLFALSAMAEESPFGEPKFHGSGCSNETTAYIATEDALSILFDSYNLSVEDTGARVKVKNCHIKVPITLPSGYTATVETVDYRGFVQLEQKATALLYTHFILGRSQWGGFRVERFKGPLEQDLFHRDVPRMTGNLPCGGKVNLSLYSLISVTAPRGKRGTMALDSADAVISLKIKPSRCH